MESLQQRIRELMSIAPTAATNAAAPAAVNKQTLKTSTKTSSPSVVSASASSVALESLSTSLSSTTTSATQSSRRCIFGCQGDTASLCRFPVHDQQRCTNWLRFFRVSAEDIIRLGGLQHFRVCLRHFNEKQQMAKTRIKTTPTRLQKDALVASTAATMTATLPLTPSTSMLAMAQDVKKRLRVIAASAPAAPPKEQLHATSTIIVPAPKRTNSISSATSSISHASDAQSAHSDNESPSPRSNESFASTTSNIKTLNSLLCKSTSMTPLSGTLKNRKVYMITEKCDQPLSTDSSPSVLAGSSGQKRKMYLIMEDTSSAPVSGDEANVGADAEADATVDADSSQQPVRKYWKTENGQASSSKKVTLYADKCDGKLTQKFEKILPEILNRIQAKNATSRQCKDNNRLPPKVVNGNGNGHAFIEVLEDNERLPITLPPKKNRTKITAMPHYNNNTSNNNNNSSHSSNSNKNNNTLSNGHHHRLGPATSAATPVIVSAVSLGHHSKRKYNGQTHAQPPVQAPANNNDQAAAIQSHTEPQPEVELKAQAQSNLNAVPQKNINLSADFLFLMKMLPKLESIPEPHKNHIKDCIEKIISQNASIFDQP